MSAVRADSILLAAIAVGMGAGLAAPGARANAHGECEDLPGEPDWGVVARVSLAADGVALTASEPEWSIDWSSLCFFERVSDDVARLHRCGPELLDLRRESPARGPP